MIIVERKNAFKTNDKVINQFEIDDLLGFQPNDNKFIEYVPDRYGVIDTEIFCIRLGYSTEISEWLNANPLKVIKYYESDDFNEDNSGRLLIKFINKNDLMLFKLTWNDYIDWNAR